MSCGTMLLVPSVRYKPDNNKLSMDESYVTAKEYAALQGVSIRTVWRWIKVGTIKGKRPGGPHGRWFIPRG